jgi:hypothetical protein
MATTSQYLRGTQLTTALSTELNALANNALATKASAITLTSGLLYLFAEVELLVSFSVAPTANTGISVWFIREIDGTNYEDGFDASVTPARAADVVFGLRAATGAQRVILERKVPPGAFYPLVKNDGTGQSMAATGNTLKLRPLTPQQV